MNRTATQPHLALDDDASIDRVEALPAQFAETLTRLRRTRTRVASIRHAVHGIGGIDGLEQLSADLPHDDGYGT